MLTLRKKIKNKNFTRAFVLSLKISIVVMLLLNIFYINPTLFFPDKKESSKVEAYSGQAFPGPNANLGANPTGSWNTGWVDTGGITVGYGGALWNTINPNNASCTSLSNGGNFVDVGTTPYLYWEGQVNCTGIGNSGVTGFMSVGRLSYSGFSDTTGNDNTWGGYPDGTAGIKLNGNLIYTDIYNNPIVTNFTITKVNSTMYLASFRDPTYGIGLAYSSDGYNFTSTYPGFMVTYAGGVDVGHLSIFYSSVLNKVFIYVTEQNSNTKGTSNMWEMSYDYSQGIGSFFDKTKWVGITGSNVTSLAFAPTTGNSAVGNPSVFYYDDGSGKPYHMAFAQYDSVNWWGSVYLIHSSNGWNWDTSSITKLTGTCKYAYSSNPGCSVRLTDSSFAVDGNKYYHNSATYISSDGILGLYFWTGPQNDASGNNSPLFHQGGTYFTVQKRIFSLNAPPVGSFDSSSCTVATGWAHDKDTPNTNVAVHIYSDGQAGQGYFVGSTANGMASPYLGQTINPRTAVDTALGNAPYNYTASQKRTDKMYGWGFQIPKELKDGVSHTLFAYAIDTVGGTNTLIGSKTIRCVPDPWFVVSNSISYSKSRNTNTVVTNPNNLSIDASPKILLNMDEGTGTVANNTYKNSNANNQYNANLTNTTWANSMTSYGKAINLNGTNSKGVISNSSLVSNKALTMEAWIYPTANRIQPILEFGNTSSYGVHLWQYDTGNKFYVNLVGTDGSSVSLFSGSPAGLGFTTSSITINAWNHVAMTFDGLVVRLYVNGVEVGRQQVTNTNFVPQTSYDLNVGFRPSGSPQYFFQGMIDDVRVYDYARTANEIATDKAGNSNVGFNFSNDLVSTNTAAIPSTFAGLYRSTDGYNNVSSNGGLWEKYTDNNMTAFDITGVPNTIVAKTKKDIDVTTLSTTCSAASYGFCKEADGTIDINLQQMPDILTTGGQKGVAYSVNNLSGKNLKVIYNLAATDTKNGILIYAPDAASIKVKTLLGTTAPNSLSSIVLITNKDVTVENTASSTQYSTLNMGIVTSSKIYYSCSGYVAAQYSASNDMDEKSGTIGITGCRTDQVGFAYASGGVITGNVDPTQPALGYYKNVGSDTNPFLNISFSGNYIRDLRNVFVKSDYSSNYVGFEY